MTLSLCLQNIRIMAKYYTRITMKRMAGLLDLSVDVSIFISFSSGKAISQCYQFAGASNGQTAVSENLQASCVGGFCCPSDSNWSALLPQQESEEFLSTLVVNKTIYAKVDRLAGIINFQRPKDPNDLLNDWSHKLNSLMSLVNKTTHLIAKEEMIHNLQWSGGRGSCIITILLVLSFCPYLETFLTTQYPGGLHKGTMSSSEFTIGRETGRPSWSFFLLSTVWQTWDLQQIYPAPPPTHLSVTTDWLSKWSSLPQNHLAEKNLVELVSMAFFVLWR